MGDIYVTAGLEELHAVAVTVQVMVSYEANVPAFTPSLYVLNCIRPHFRSVPLSDPSK
jgi:hypothetical protein